MFNTIVGVWYRLLDWEEEVDDNFFRQLEEISYLQALIFMGEFPHPSTCWKDNTARQKKCRRFLESLDDNFLTQVTKKLLSGGAGLDLILTKNLSGLWRVTPVTTGWWRQGPERKEQGRKQHHNHGHKEKRFGPFQRPASINPVWSGSRERRIQESWLVFKNCFLQAQEWSILTCRKSEKDSRRSAWLNMKLLTTQIKKGRIQDMKAGSGYPGGI